ncbi:hypothetical protein HN014_10705 [Aquimarina sp. TRL1]|uniref:hypothetical protein n=1 Tax=Aquimarina sp. (strain TRL1) TaxID=2736252 RepID=UPI00158A7F13|nr:hypothetical protein [Aquimarina sp. TRL1]QKX05364.1 hypothetical protein HN014_10705 [Aquimarina sp. TRL1]
MNTFVNPANYSFYPSATDDSFLHHIQRRHGIRPKSRKKLFHRSLRLSHKRRIQPLRIRRKKTRTRSIRPINKRKLISRKGAIPMVLPRQKPYRINSIPRKSVTVSKPTRYRSTTKKIKKKKPKMVTLNFPAPARKSKGIRKNIPMQNRFALETFGKHQAKATVKTPPQKDKNKQKGNGLFLSVKIGITLTVVLAGIWIYKSTKKN